MSQVWIVDDDESIRWVLQRALEADGLGTRKFEDAEGAIEAMADEIPQVIITDLRMSGESGMALLSRVSENLPDIPVIVITAHSDLDTSVEAFTRGAFEYLPKPFDIDQVCDAVKRALRAGRDSDSEPAQTPAGGSGIIGQSPVMQQLFRQIGKLSRTRLNVLITGETGTGKELLARAVHRHSPRASGPFVALNTAAIPGELLESELFGHEQGAFTGAHKRREGRFEQADGGTLFLDEIGDMPAALQSRLLRVLAEGEFYRVGGRSLRRSDVRIISATHQDLETAVTAGQFREDLYHRLNVIRLKAPALRERGSDIALLADHFLAEAAREVELEPKQMAADARARLMEHAWPGNVRELENVCRRLAVMVMGNKVDAADINAVLESARAPSDETMTWVRELRLWADREFSNGTQDLLKDASDALQRELIEAALAQTGGGRIKAAELLGCGRNSLTRWMNQLGIDQD